MALGVYAYWLSNRYTDQDIRGASLAFTSALFLIPAFMGIAGTIGLLNFQGWGRLLTLISSVLVLLLSFPFGLPIGIWSLVVLLNRKNAEDYKKYISAGA